MPEPGRHPAQPPEIGSYRILELLGQGGMGTVYLAEQHGAIRRTAAVKVLRVGLDSKEVLGRFENERQALAIMDHPSIARVFDAGMTDAGMPFLAMEYVPGVPITEFCDQLRLDLKGRLELFLQVADGVQHAHHKGVIHRDLKPSNVLAYQRDGAACAKIIDFGVAKATDQSLTERTMFTEMGQILGTPEYMSPEQAEMTEAGVDARTDIYSLGVLLYELLAGALPFDSKELRGGGFLELRRIIREQEPRRPSTRFTTLAGNEAVAAHRRSERGTWGRLLRGDLDWVILHALEKDPARRYQTASELAQDLRRYLAGRPVEARPPSVLYRWSTFVRRNRVPVALAAALLMSLVLGLVLSVVQFRRAEDEAATATAMANEARQESVRSHALATELATSKQSLEAEFARSEGSRLLLLARDLMTTDQGLAVALAVAGARLNPSFEANRTLAALATTLRVSAAVELPLDRARQFTPTPDGVLGLGSDGLACHIDLRRSTAGQPFPLLTAARFQAWGETAGTSRLLAFIPPEHLEIVRQMAPDANCDLAMLGGDPITYLPAVRSIDPEHMLRVEPRQLTVLAKVDGRQVATIGLTRELRGLDSDADQVWILEEDDRVERWQWRRNRPPEPVVQLQALWPAGEVDRDDPAVPVALMRPFRVFAASGRIVWRDGPALSCATLSDGAARRIARGAAAQMPLHADDRCVVSEDPLFGCSVHDLDGKRLWRQPLIAPQVIRLGGDAAVLGVTEDRHARIVSLADGSTRYVSAEPVATWRWCEASGRLWSLSPGGSLRAVKPLAGKVVVATTIRSARSLLATWSDGVALLRGEHHVEFWRSTPRVADLRVPSACRPFRIDEGALLTLGDLPPGSPGALMRFLGPRIGSGFLSSLTSGTGKPGRIWSAETGARLLAMHGGQRQGLWRLFSPDGRRAWIPRSATEPDCALECDTASGNGTSPVGMGPLGLRRFGLLTGRTCMESFVWLDEPGTCLFSSAVNGIHRRTADGATLRIRNPANPRSLLETRTMIGVGSLGHDRFVLSAPRDRAAIVQGIEERELTLADDKPLGTSCLASQQMVVVVGEKSIEAFDATSGGSRWRHPLVDAALVWTASDDGRRFAYGTQHGAVTVLRADDGTTVCRTQPTGERVLAIAFDAPGIRVAFGTAQGLVTVLGCERGDPTHEFPPQADDVPCLLGFAADGSTLVVLGFDGTFTFWPLDLLPFVEKVMPRQLTAEERERHAVRDR